MKYTHFERPLAIINFLILAMLQFDSVVFRTTCLAGLFMLTALIPGYSSGTSLEDPDFLDRCPIPKFTSIRNVSESSADLFWTASDSALSVDLEWRVAGSPDWIMEPGVVSPFTLLNLTACTPYEVRLVAHCNGSDSDPSSVMTFVVDGCCRIPTGLLVSSATDVSARISWDSVSFAFAHHFRYRAVGEDEWIETEVDTHFINLSDLEPCTAYEAQVGSQCDLDSTEYSASVLFETMACGFCSQGAYCPAFADDATSEWIDSVSFATVRFKSGSNNGYLLRNTVVATLERERPYAFHVQPASVFPGSEFYLRVWIDLNQDSVFTDSTELLIDPITPVTTAGFTGTLVIPDTFPLGTTRMRIALEAIIDQDTLKPEACGSFLFGEVEDYCIEIDDICPEAVPVVESVTSNSATIAWPAIEEAIVIVYQYKKAEDAMFGEPELTQDSMILLGDLEECTDYVLQTLSVCVQDTSSVRQFHFKTECPDAVQDILPLADHIRVFPNPFSDHLSIEFEPLVTGEAYLSVFNVVGSQLHHEELNLLEGQQVLVTLNRLDRLSHGVYFVSIHSTDRRVLVKVVK